MASGGAADRRPALETELAWLESLQGSGIRPGLARVRALLRTARHPERAAPTIIVAGTNGKGSTSATLSSILHTAGYRVGLYTSPHLVRINERWRVAEQDVDDRALRDGIRELRKIARESKFAPTYFEALTVLAFLLFRKAECEVVVLEVGMGGRLDATNVTRPIAAIISQIGLDHREYLGETIPEIAGEKAGVIHRGSDVLTSNRTRAALDVIVQRAKVVGASRVHVVPLETNATKVSIETDRLSFRLQTPRGRYELSSPLPGKHQVSNISLAVRSAEVIRKHFPKIDKEVIETGVAATRWGGRLERIVRGEKTIWIDGAHNLDGVKAVVPFIRDHVPTPRTLVFGAMRDKEYGKMLEELLPLFDEIVVTEADPERGTPPETLRKVVEKAGRKAQSKRSPRNAVAAALFNDPASIVVCGSLYLAGSALGILKENSKFKIQNSKR